MIRWQNAHACGVYIVRVGSRANSANACAANVRLCLCVCTVHAVSVVLVGYYRTVPTPTRAYRTRRTRARASLHGTPVEVYSVDPESKVK